MRPSGSITVHCPRYTCGTDRAKPYPARMPDVAKKVLTAELNTAEAAAPTPSRVALRNCVAQLIPNSGNPERLTSTQTRQTDFTKVISLPPVRAAKVGRPVRAVLAATAPSGRRTAISKSHRLRAGPRIRCSNTVSTTRTKSEPLAKSKMPSPIPHPAQGLGGDSSPARRAQRRSDPVSRGLIRWHGSC